MKNEHWRRVLLANDLAWPEVDSMFPAAGKTGHQIVRRAIAARDFLDDKAVYASTGDRTAKKRG